MIYFDTSALLKLIRADAQSGALGTFIGARPSTRWFTLTEAAAIEQPFLRTLDAIHLAAATSVRAGLSAFVTYDKRLAAAAGEIGLPVLSPA